MQIELKRKKWRLSTATKKKMAESKLGDKNPAKRQEVRKKIADTLAGKPAAWITSENREKICKKISDSKMGKNNGMYGKTGCLNPFYDKHHSDEVRNILREVAKGNNYNPKRGFGKGGYYESPLQGRIWLRSAYELAYAQWLDKNNILWMYEMETFDLGETTYTPDFFLPQFEKFIEIKGWMNPVSKAKIDMFLEQHPWELEILRYENLVEMGVLC